MPKEIKCKKCGKCCKYMLLDLDKEHTKDYANWINLHKGAKVVKIDGGYLVRIELKCKMLKNNCCSIYKNRPQLCKNYNCQEYY